MIRVALAGLLGRKLRTALTALAIVLGNLLPDLVAPLIDPRIKLQ